MRVPLGRMVPFEELPEGMRLTLLGARIAEDGLVEVSRDSTEKELLELLASRRERVAGWVWVNGVTGVVTWREADGYPDGVDIVVGYTVAARMQQDGKI